MTLLKFGCMKFMAPLLGDTGIDNFCSCTISGACMHVFHISHLKEKTIAWVPPNCYRSMRNYSSRWDGSRSTKRCPIQARVVWGEMYLKDVK